MAYLTFGANSAYARASTSQSNIGTATTLSRKRRVTGAWLLSAAGTGSRDSGIGATVTTGLRCRVNVGQVGGSLYFSLYTSTGTAVAQSAYPGGGLATSALVSGDWYVIYYSVGPAECRLEIIADDGTLLHSITGAGVTVPNAAAANGLVTIGATVADGLVGANDGDAIYSVALSGADRYSAPAITDTGILWYIPFDEGSGTSAANAVSGATALNTLSGTSWGAGGTWDGPSGGTTYTESLTDSATVADTVTPRVVARATLTDGIGATDSVSAGTADAENLTDTASAADSVAARTVARRSLTDTATVTDSVTLALAATFPDEGATAGDSVTPRMIVRVSLTDSLAATDSLSAGGAVEESATDSATAADSVSARIVARHTLTDTASTTDSAATHVVARGSLVADSVTATDSVTPRSVVRISLTDTALATDSVSEQVPGSDSEALTETCAATDSVTARVIARTSVSEAVLVTDTTALRVVARVTVTDAATGLDTVALLLDGEGGPTIDYPVTLYICRAASGTHYIRRDLSSTETI